MKILRLIVAVSLVLLCPLEALAYKGVMATQEGIQLLKKDLVSGELEIGKARLMAIRKVYGDASNIDISERRITFNYGDLRLVFDKKRYWREWEYDSFKERVYSDDVDDLRYDLESGQIVGDNITYEKIIRKYDVPTESFEKDDDGEESIYYYGDIKLTFENYFVLQNWRGKKLGHSGDEDNLKTK